MEKIKKHLAKTLASITNLNEDKILSLIEKPKKRSWGLFSFPVFSLSREPHQKAKELCEKINQSPQCSFIKKAGSIGGFVNFHFKDEYLLKTFNEFFENPDFFSKTKNKEVIVVDYSSPNAAKFMNVGHLRATAIGQAVVNTARAFGHKVIALNHLGDWGTQFGKLITAYKKWGRGKKITLPLLADLYVRFHQEAKTNDSLNESARLAFKKMEQRDPEITKLWSLFVEVSIKEYNKLWKKLNTRHDLMRGESFYADKTKNVEKVLTKKNLLKESEGAKVVFLDPLPPCLIQKKDGASTYAARDLASIFYRFEVLKADKNIYTAGVDHTLHFNQLKKVLDKINKQWAENTCHLSFGMYRFKGQGKLSSRHGKTVRLADMIQEASQRALKIIKEKNPALKNKEATAEKIACGALIFNDLMNDRIKDVDFSWDRMLDFEGDSGPFVQYCHARSASLLKKAGAENLNSKIELKIKPQDLEPIEREWIEKLLEFETAGEASFRQFKPHILAVYLLDICHVFSRFYSKKRIIGSPKQADLIQLTRAVKAVLKKGLDLLNIESPSAM